MWKGTNGHECKEVGKCHYHPQSGHQNSWELGGRKSEVGWVKDLYIGERPVQWEVSATHRGKDRASSWAGEAGVVGRGRGRGTTPKGTFKSP